MSDLTPVEGIGSMRTIVSFYLIVMRCLFMYCYDNYHKVINTGFRETKAPMRKPDFSIVTKTMSAKL